MNVMYKFVWNFVKTPYRDREEEFDDRVAADHIRHYELILDPRQLVLENVYEAAILLVEAVYIAISRAISHIDERLPRLLHQQQYQYQI